jgi:hypothetical protein
MFLNPATGAINNDLFFARTAKEAIADCLGWYNKNFKILACVPLENY